ncbi:MAG: hypothetical protein LBQ46_03540 [Treponema sp.]|nr:hypothetical protein [Treponema sp.]
MAAVITILLCPAAFSLGRRDTSGPSGPADPVALPANPGRAVPGPGGTLLHDGDRVELTGRVRLVGSEPFPDLVLTGPDDQDWYLEGASRQLLRPYEQQTVSVRGKVELREMILANGRSLGFRRILLEVEILDTK